MNLTIHQDAIYLFPSLVRAVEIAIVSKRRIKPFVNKEYGRQNAIDDFKVAGVMDWMEPEGTICYEHCPPDFNTLMQLKHKDSTIDLAFEFSNKKDKITINENLEIDSACKVLLKTAFDRLTMSSLDYNFLLHVSAHIAALDGKTVIKAEHMAEAIHYRVLDLDKHNYNDSIPVFKLN